MIGNVWSWGSTKRTFLLRLNPSHFSYSEALHLWTPSADQCRRYNHHRTSSRNHRCCYILCDALPSTTRYITTNTLPHHRTTTAITDHRHTSKTTTIRAQIYITLEKPMYEIPHHDLAGPLLEKRPCLSSLSCKDSITGPPFLSNTLIDVLFYYLFAHR